MANLVGDSNSADIPAVSGTNPTGHGLHGQSTSGAGVWGVSEVGEGVHGETNAPNLPAVTGFNSGGSAGVWGQSTSGPGTFGISDSGEGVHGETRAPDLAAVAGINTGEGVGVYGQSISGRAVVGISTTGEGVHGATNAPDLAAVVGINESTGPGVYGRGSNWAGVFEGNVLVTGDLTTNGDIFLPNADCAEEFDAEGETPIDPGTLMVLDDSGRLCVSVRPYDRRVIGVVSGAGSLRSGIVLGKRDGRQNAVQIALVGTVYCKVDTHNNPVRVGDLLTSSPTPGHAMKAEEGGSSFGAVIGKAMGFLAEGTGMIPILVALQ